MKIVRINQLDESRSVAFTGGISHRAVLESDNMGFAICKTMIPKGGPHHWHYPYHLEACYCIKGKGILRCSGIEVLITPDVVYLLDKHDDHTFEALEDTVLISVFNPPITGNESHDENGHYPKSKAVHQLALKLYDAVEGSPSKYDAIEKIESLINP